MKPIEKTLIWMAIRYAMNRTSIASLTLPGEIMASYVDELSNRSWADGLLTGLVRDINRDYGGNPDYENKAFPDDLRGAWFPLVCWLDGSNRFKVLLVDPISKEQIEKICLRCDHRFYPIDTFRGFESPFANPVYIISVEHVGGNSIIGSMKDQLYPRTLVFLSHLVENDKHVIQ